MGGSVVVVASGGSDAGTVRTGLLAPAVGVGAFAGVEIPVKLEPVTRTT
jgi:hypothetical protein